MFGLADAHAATSDIARSTGSHADDALTALPSNTQAVVTDGSNKDAWTSKIKGDGSGQNVETGQPADTTAPETTLTSGPPATNAPADAQFTFTASEAATFQCRVDAGAWAPCSSPKSLTGLTGGAHTFEVRATDTAGNTDPSPALANWSVTLTGAAAYTQAVQADTPLGFFHVEEAAGATSFANVGSLAGTGTRAGTGMSSGQAGSGVWAGTFGATYGGGTGGVLRTGINPANDGTATLEAWVNTAGSGAGTRGVIVKQYAYGIFLKDSKPMIYDWNSGSVSTATTAINDSHWHLLTLTVSGGQQTLYVDGASQFTQPSGVTDATREVVVGSGGFGTTEQTSQPMYGYVDEIAVYDQALSPGRISAHVQAR